MPNFLFTSYFKVFINLFIGAASYQLIFLKFNNINLISEYINIQ